MPGQEIRGGDQRGAGSDVRDPSRTEHETSDGEQDGFATVVLSSPDGVDAAFAPGIGMVGCSLRHEGRELLGKPDGLPAYAERGATFGIPLLHPWANRLGGWSYAAAGRSVTLDRGSPLLHTEQNELPIHGVLAAAPDWEPVAWEAGPDRARLVTRLDFGAVPERLATFPFPHALELEVVLRGRALELTTTIHAAPDGPVPVSFGWHPYLAPPGAPRAEWTIEAPAGLEHLELDPRMIPTGTRSPAGSLDGPLGSRTFDDGYASVAPGSVFAVEDGERRIEVRMGDGYPYAQVFAPPDLDVVCFEPMTAPADALRSGDGLRLVPAGERFAATWSLEVTPLDP